MDRKAALRLLMKGTAAERKERLDHPLVRYNDLGQIVCKICNTIVKPEVAWNTHLISRQHKESVARLKSKAQNAAKQAAPATLPPTQSGTSRKASELPTDFFDAPESKQLKSGSLQKNTAPARAPSPANPPPEDPTASAAVPPGFFDQKRQPPVSSTQKPGQQGATRTTDQQKEGDTGPKGVLPKGFFDDKEKDQKARGEEVAKVDMNEEWKEFQKLVQVNIEEVDVRQEEEEAEAADEREERELLEQKSFLQHIEELRQQKEAKERAKAQAAAAAAAQQANKMEEDAESDDEDEEEDFALHWRAKKV